MDHRPFRIFLFVSFFTLAFNQLFGPTARGRPRSTGKRVAGAQLRLFDRDRRSARPSVRLRANTRFKDSFSEYLLEEMLLRFRDASQTISVSGDQYADVALLLRNKLKSSSLRPVRRFITGSAKTIDVVDSDQIALRNELSIAEAIRNLPAFGSSKRKGRAAHDDTHAWLRAQNTEVLIRHAFAIHRASAVATFWRS
jgi:hypothetical protein